MFIQVNSFERQRIGRDFLLHVLRELRGQPLMIEGRFSHAALAVDQHKLVPLAAGVHPIPESVAARQPVRLHAIAEDRILDLIPQLRSRS